LIEIKPIANYNIKMLENFLKLGRRQGKTREEFASTDPVEAWTLSNIPTIVKAMLAVRSNYAHAGSTFDFNLFDFSQRSLSEMCVCQMWQCIKPPPGFDVITNGEAVLHMTSGEAINAGSHIFAGNRAGMQLCFSFAQYYDKQEEFRTDLSPGMRTEYYREKGPNLIKIFDYENYLIARLYGHGRQIRDKLGLQFRRAPSRT